MKLKVHCDFCSHCQDANIDPTVMKLHEEKCKYNPAKKQCFSCVYIRTDDHYGVEYCDIGANFEKFEEFPGCPLWSDIDKID